MHRRETLTGLPIRCPRLDGAGEWHRISSIRLAAMVSFSTAEDMLRISIGLYISKIPMSFGLGIPFFYNSFLLHLPAIFFHRFLQLHFNRYVTITLRLRQLLHYKQWR
jgi:hypothetical protein